jgi:hypothetical protein
VANRTCSLILVGFLVGLFFNSEDGGGIFLRNFGRTSIELHGVTSQKIALFIVTAWRTSTPTNLITVQLGGWAWG